MYRVKEIFTTIQGEGFNAGKAATFLRFAGCNLWSGYEDDRLNGPGSCSQWCDTDFVGGNKYSLEELVNTIVDLSGPIDFIVCTGGEPLLQLDPPLVKALHEHRFKIAIETNGTIKPKSIFEWICVSPKAGTKLVQNWGNELKFIYPQGYFRPEQFESDEYAFDHLYIQPMDGPNIKENTALAVEFVKKNPKWRLSLQTHKFINIP